MPSDKRTDVKIKRSNTASILADASEWQVEASAAAEEASALAHDLHQAAAAVSEHVKVGTSQAGIDAGEFVIAASTATADARTKHAEAAAAAAALNAAIDLHREAAARQTAAQPVTHAAEPPKTELRAPKVRMHAISAYARDATRATNTHTHTHTHLHTRARMHTRTRARA